MSEIAEEIAKLAPEMNRRVLLAAASLQGAERAFFMHAAGIIETDGVNSVEICEPAPYLGPSLGDQVLVAEKELSPESIFEREAKRGAQERNSMREQSLRHFLKRKRTKQPAGKCACGRTISGNKRNCAACAPKE